MGTLVLMLVLGGSPYPDVEAEWLALELDGTIGAATGRYRQIHEDLERIRAARPALRTFERNAVPMRLTFEVTDEFASQFREAGSKVPEAWRTTMRTYGLRLVSAEDVAETRHERLRKEGTIPVVTLETLGRYARAQLYWELGKLPGMQPLTPYSVGSLGREFPPAIEVSVLDSTTRRYIFKHYDDCPAGCILAGITTLFVSARGVRGISPPDRPMRPNRPLAPALGFSTSTAGKPPKPSPANWPGSE